MSSACRSALLAAFALLAALPAAAAAPPLRVCADPNNLPFSDQAGEGFENRIVELLGRALDAPVTYTWWAQRRGFIRNTLQAGSCDIVPGVPSAVDLLRTTRPYYRSSYMFVTRGDAPEITSFDDPRLRALRIGVQLIGDDGANSPPAHALARRGIVGHLRGYPVFGDYATPEPTMPIMEAVTAGDVDLAVVWGPLAGYYARHHPDLRLTPVAPQVDLPMLPMIYDIAMGVRREDRDLRTLLDTALARHRAEIDAILDAYGVPRLDPAGAPIR